MTIMKNKMVGFPEVSLLVMGLAAMWLMPNDLSFLTRIITSALFVLSLDLVLGYGGIVTLGHAAFFGVGAYAAGVYAISISGEPLTGLLVGGVVGGLVALVTGALLLRTHGLTCLMMTIAIAQILLEVLNKWRSVTGGDDGLSGIVVEPIFGVFEFDFMGRTGFVYSLVILVVCFWIMRKLVSSPFGLTCVGIREDRLRMTALGCNVYLHALVMYVAGGVFAGIAGALMAQTTQVVGLSSLGFTWSAEALVMLVLGGMGHLWGAVIGTILFMVVHHFASAIDPFQWMFVIGGLLVAVVLLFPQGLAQAGIGMFQKIFGYGRIAEEKS
ncbi:MAG: branched-chain amino acid ABC transporter permease [Pusillimonas sp.]|nr:branched-chain amino acid ABC transporter permease [Pusillimonas sp.]|tara:strand:- start:151735 stop:152715 length:981 start_codon:yes stop_codon:yes gene_type:complete